MRNIRFYDILFVTLILFANLPMNEFDTAALVKRARKASNMTQISFADLIKKSQEMVCKYENGTHKPPGDTIIRCIRILEKTDISGIDEDEELAELIAKISKFKGADMAPKRTALRTIVNALLAT